jgi:hypothetical protein
MASALTAITVRSGHQMTARWRLFLLPTIILKSTSFLA